MSAPRSRAPWGLTALVVGGLVAAPGPAAASEGARAQLERMIAGAQERHYEGVLIYGHGESLETLRLVHRAGEDGSRERLYTLTGPRREIIRNRDEVICIFPERREVVVDRRQLRNPLADAVPDEIGMLEESYRFALEGEERVAGRQTRVVAIVPRDDLRYGYRFWVDEESGVPLQVQVLSEEDELLERVLFTRFRLLDDVPEEWLEPALDHEDWVWLRYDKDRGDAAAAERAPWVVSEPPPGFRAAGYRRTDLPGKDEPVDHLLFSDGLAVVSIYVKAGKGRTPEGLSRIGGAHAFGHRLDDYHVTVVGDVPAATVKRFARQIRPARNQAE